MIKKARWIAWGLVLLLFAGTLAYRWSLVPTGGNWVAYLSALVVVELFFIVPGVMITLVLAFLFRKDAGYWTRFFARLPFVLALVAVPGMLIGTASWWYPKMSGLDPMSETDLDQVMVDPDLDCSSIREGVFRGDGGHRLERYGDKQTDIHILGLEAHREVFWIAPCTYELRSGEPGYPTVRVKVLSVDSLGYDYAIDHSDGTGIIHQGRMERVR